MLCSTDNLGEVVGEFRANVAAVAGFINVNGQRGGNLGDV
jgi:hypothetical protein